ncbi:MAG: flagellar biosynthesis protein FlhB [Candidatus Cohnella colombiensis]|uniref:Flagellar biosynthetic protein FlhB n=1 Tax=Candidatus Cohnella colombiensis TaxID=3121368 RepID=A0AA95F056_9BACL|nr:MAG: flagellar biosynthesis protein FlhB [Cohnella sp.]
MIAVRLRMNLQLFAGEKSEKATPKKRQDSRKKGQVAKSREIPSAFILLGGISCLMMLGSFFRDRILMLFNDVFLNRLTMEVTTENVYSMLYQYMVQIIIFLLPIFVIVIVIIFVGYYVQIGWLLTMEPLKPKLNKLNPIKGAKNIFGPRALVEFFKSSLKMLSVGLVVYTVIWGERSKFLTLATVPIQEVFSYVAGLVLKLGIYVSALMIILAIADYMYQKYEHEKNLKMSKQDIKDEHKNQEGDPLIKGKIRERQRRMALMRMMQEVPNADVIITNPTHFAVALQYDGSKMDAPRVIAKGQDYLALRIREIAKQHDIIMMENKPLARALYERTEIGDSVPADLFQAVAEVLAYVYRLKGRRRA